MRHFAPAIAVAACVLTACTELPSLGVCGNGIVEATGGEDCDEPDATGRCLGCRLVCDLDLPEDGTCPDGVLCCLAGQRCGHDHLCRAPSGLFAPPGGFFPFPATQVEIADVDFDGLGDAFGVNRQQATFVYGAIGGPTRQAAAPIPTQSQPDSQVAYATFDRAELSAPGMIAGTPRGFVVLVTDGNRLFSPPLPEVELEEAGNTGDGFDPDHGLAVAPSGTGDLVGLLAEHRSDTGGQDRVALRVFRDRLAVPTEDTVCGKSFAPAPGETILAAFGDVRIADTSGGEYAVATATMVTDGGGGSVTTALCIYESPPVAAASYLDLVLPPDRVPLVMRPVQLDGDPCPEVVAQLGDLAGQLEYVQYWDVNGAACDAAATGLVQSGHLVGAGDLDGDGRDEILVDRAGYRNILAPGGPDDVVGLLLPEGLDSAVVADVNRDGRADIAAIGLAALDLTIVLRVDAGYAPRTVASIGALRELVTGDFDADTYADVAAIEASPTDLERVVVAFGGPTGPQGFDSIGRMGGAHALVSHVDRVPVASSDAFADLLLIDDTLEGGQEITQFNGSSTRALTSQIDLTGPEPTGDNNTTFARTVAGGELVRPRDGLDDFCVVSYGNEPAPGGTETFGRAFCVGSEGAMLAIGRLADAGAFSADSDLIEPGEPLPLLVSADVASASGGEPVAVLVAMRRDRGVPPELIVMAPPVPQGPPVESITTARLADRLPLPALPGGFERWVIVNGMRALQLDDDVDSELIVSLLDYRYDPVDESISEISFLLYRVELSRAGDSVEAVATPMFAAADRACSDARRVELGDTMPDGAPAAPGEELVVLCSDYLQAWYRGTDGTEHGPFPVGTTDGGFGALAVGDLTGDRLDDLAMLVGDDRDAYLLVMPQCPAHDASACSAAISADDR